jgi:carbamate kinase
MTKKPRIVVALGGNAILQRGQKGTAKEQMENVQRTANQIIELVKAGSEVVITHGNGPQVGAILIQNELASSSVPPMPMQICGAESQGLIGYLFCQALERSLIRAGVDSLKPICFLTRVLVDKNDQAFENPTKPVGPFYTEEEAKKRLESTNETWIEDSGRGWRRVVPSPYPKDIVEAEAINKILSEDGYLVVASGGGGIPVIRDEEGALQGIEAVIDKDLAGALLAEEVNADIFMILTDVPGVAINFGTKEQKQLGKVTVEELERYKEEGHFRKGSMLPKVEAAIGFVKKGGSRSVIASLEQAVVALDGEAGTQVTL